jgi:hypothetical protein
VLEDLASPGTELFERILALARASARSAARGG